MKPWSKILQKMRSDKKLTALAAVLLAGLVLLAFSGGSSEKTAKDAATDTARARLERSMETRLERLLQSVEGVGKVRVLVTVECMEQTVYARNETSAENGRQSSEIVLTDSRRTALRESVSAPRVRGVAVSCAGGGSAKVRQEVASLVCAALGVSANRVYVSKLSN